MERKSRNDQAIEELHAFASWYSQEIGIAIEGTNKREFWEAIIQRVIRADRG